MKTTSKIMAILGSVLKSTTKYASRLNKDLNTQNVKSQEKQLKKLLVKAKGTEFGKKYGFSEMLRSENITKTFREKVPIFDYDLMYSMYWHKTLSGVENVSWPGKISRFALTSGTTGSSSKRIPVSEPMIQSIKRSAMRQLLGLCYLDIKAEFYEKDILFLGGSTTLTQINDQFEGDLSGILTNDVPYWLSPFSKPDKKIRAISDWGEKIEKIVQSAPDWDIGVIAGVPSWVQIMIERIMEHHKLDSIFEIWPNLKIYVHGGVSFDPYVLRFNELFDNRVVYLDTYLCSEGFFAYQPTTSDSLHLLLNHGIYYEFIPFNAENFDENGELRNFNSGIGLSEVRENVDYALLITTNSGAWRYLIGDTIRFKCLNTYKIKVTGRTKHFLSLVGEHLSVDNMTEALTRIAYKLGIEIPEFAVLGETYRSGFGHRWFLGCDQKVSEEKIRILLDEQLKYLNDDYRIERAFGLTDVHIHIIPTRLFYDFMKIKDKYGAQHKFPRVLKGKLAEDWMEFISIVHLPFNPRLLIH